MSNKPITVIKLKTREPSSNNDSESFDKHASGQTIRLDYTFGIMTILISN